MNRLKLIVLSMCLLGATASAEDFVAYARVVKVVPLSQEISQSRVACPAEPREGDLVATLRWSLCVPSEPVEQTEGYRVYYEWDDHIYERVVAWRPDTKVPIRVSIEATTR